MKTHEVTVTPTEIREAWAAIQRGSNPFTPKQDAWTQPSLSRYRGSKVDTWVGASGEQIQHRLEHGYTPEGEITADLSGSEGYITPSFEYDDEYGDLLVDHVLSGEEFYRVDWQEVEAPRSLTIRANIGFSANVDAPELARYLGWVLKVADAARRNGVVPSIELTITMAKGLVRSQDEVRVLIPLVNAGEMVDEMSWRAYLAPGAFRSLGFIALVLAADKLKRSITRGLGYPTNHAWSVVQNDDVLTITCPGSMDTFPEDRLDGMLETATREAVAV